MRMTLLMLLLLTVHACKSANTAAREPRATPEEEAPATPAASESPAAGLTAANAEPSASASGTPILKKIVGALSKEDPKAQHYECTVLASDIPQLAQVEQWIKEVAAAPIVEALYFRPTIPSIQIFAYQNGAEVLLFESYSTARYRRPTNENSVKNDTAEELIKIAHQKCPYP